MTTGGAFRSRRGDLQKYILQCQPPCCSRVKKSLTNNTQGMSKGFYRVESSGDVGRRRRRRRWRRSRADAGWGGLSCFAFCTWHCFYVGIGSPRAGSDHTPNHLSVLKMTCIPTESRHYSPVKHIEAKFHHNKNNLTFLHISIGTHFVLVLHHCNLKGRLSPALPPKILTFHISPKTTFPINVLYFATINLCQSTQLVFEGFVLAI